jgi:hypothetical protein
MGMIGIRIWAAAFDPFANGLEASGRSMRFFSAVQGYWRS